MKFVRLHPVAAIAAALLLIAGCKPEPERPGHGPADAAVSGAITNYAVRGIVKSLKPAEKEVVIRHEEIPGYMIAMTMPFNVRDANELQGIHPGDAVEFRMRVTEKDAWIDQLRVVASTHATPTPTPVAASPTNPPPAFRVLPSVPELKVGDVVPDYAFTNQLGEPFKLSRFRGDALAVTFIFTRCPYPLFCPRMSDNFSTTQKLLMNRAGGPTNWHLISLSFDPEYDTPETMKAYGGRWGANPAHWTLATGSFDQIEPMATSSGLYFGRGVGIAEQNHNLRTLVIGPQGRLEQILIGNQWTAEELADALAKAAANP